MDIRTMSVEKGFNKAYEYLDRNPEENLPKLISLVRKMMPEEEYEGKFILFEMAINDKESPWHKLLLSLWTDVDADVRKTAFRNFIVNAFFRWSQMQKPNEKAYGFRTPWTILMDPTSACNLHCTGCWAAEYGNRLNLSFDELDSIIEQGKKLGIIGMGNIGQRVARIAVAFGMEVAYYSTSGTSHCKDYPSLPLEDLLSVSDIVTIHAPLNDATRNLVTYDRLKLMKPSAYILNMGRGGIINEQDLADALSDNIIAGAATDVYAREPLEPGHPYLRFRDYTDKDGRCLKEKLLLTPHIAWTSNEALKTLVEKIAENITL